MTKNIVRFPLRIPSDVYGELRDVATIDNRSINATIVRILEKNLGFNRIAERQANDRTE